MRCNYRCTGCYSRDYACDNELTSPEIDSLFAEAVKLGVCAFVITGGEPFLRDDIVSLMCRYRSLLFIPITNGSRIDARIARQCKKSGNIMPLVSIEGDAALTDRRRQPGAYATAMQAFSHFRDAGMCFGFAATNTAENTGYLGSDTFIDTVRRAGCSIGFFSEYVPCGPSPRTDWLLSTAQRNEFRERVLQIRTRGTLMLVQFPHDEYGEHNRCTAAGTLSLHINAQGGIEPCPFVSVSRESIRRGGLRAACESRFLASIRNTPSLLQRHHYACSLFEHMDGVRTLATESNTTISTHAEHIAP
jgi:MoaA/NifB/PqqE/SkfB family radical SAM enzyme